MPIIKVNLIEGFATLAEKSQITMEMTEALVTVMGEVTRQFTYVSVEDMKPGAVSMGGQLVTEETMRGGLVLSEQELAVKLTASRVKAAYAALDSGDRTAIEQYWDKDLTWSVPGANPLAGTYEGSTPSSGTCRAAGTSPAARSGRRRSRSWSTGTSPPTSAATPPSARVPTAPARWPPT